ncbi:hypothetical protein D3C78_1297650 [compost metagenome]
MSRPVLLLVTLASTLVYLGLMVASLGWALASTRPLIPEARTASSRVESKSPTQTKGPTPACGIQGPEDCR